MVSVTFELNPDTGLYEGLLKVTSTGVLFLNCNNDGKIIILATTSTISPITIIEIDTKNAGIIAQLTLEGFTYKISSSVEVLLAVFTGEGSDDSIDVIRAIWQQSSSSMEIIPKYTLGDASYGLMIYFVFTEDEINLLEGMTTTYSNRIVTTPKETILTTTDVTYRVTASNISNFPGTEIGDYVIGLLPMVAFGYILATEKFEKITILYNSHKYDYNIAALIGS